MRQYDQFLSRARARYGSRFDSSDLALQFAPYLHDPDTRIQVLAYGEVRTGLVGVTTGWRPAFLLLSTRRSLGSSLTLSHGMRLLAVKGPYDRQYKPVPVPVTHEERVRR